MFYCKRKQKNFYLDIKDYFKFILNDNLEKENLVNYTTADKDHGRIERRDNNLVYNIDWLYDKEDWKNLSMI